MIDPQYLSATSFNNDTEALSPTLSLDFLLFGLLLIFICARWRRYLSASPCLSYLDFFSSGSKPYALFALILDDGTSALFIFG